MSRRASVLPGHEFSAGAELQLSGVLGRHLRGAEKTISLDELRRALDRLVDEARDQRYGRDVLLGAIAAVWERLTGQLAIDPASDSGAFDFAIRYCVEMPLPPEHATRRARA